MKIPQTLLLVGGLLALLAIGIDAWTMRARRRKMVKKVRRQLDELVKRMSLESR